ncbi:MAG: hypothetical protein ACQERC_09710 [Bacteroidota bacterium]
MKLFAISLKVSLLSVFIAISSNVIGQVMFSQYIETDSGTSPKGVEIYNHSGSSIDFSVDPLEVYKGVNGGTCSNDVTVNSGVLLPGEVWVIGTTDLVNDAQNNGTNLSGTTNHSFTFNGDDALELYLNGTLMDVFGTCGTDPGSAWSGNGVSTANQNIQIANGICSGTTTYWTDPSLRYETVSSNPSGTGGTTGFGDAPSCNFNTITIDNLSSLTYEVVCDTPDTGSLDFSSTGTFNTGNEFIVELSDNSGSFASSTYLDTLSGANAEGTDPSETINFTIPTSVAGGTGYRMRVIATDPATTGTDNGTDITITSSPCPATLPASGGLLINEFSNGSTGSQEYYEFVVAGKCGETVDVRGYIIDDNNGTFSEASSYPGGSGIASGHLRLTNHSQWSNIPVGSVIVVYNNGDPNGSLPGDDPFDSDNDSLYVVPHDNTTLFEIDGAIPNASDPDSTYSPATYASTSWSGMGIANGGDAVQIRQPDGSYFHGVSYGGSEISGGPEGTKITNSGLSGQNASFTSGDFKDANNWIIGNASGDETPGTFNNAANEEWLRLMRDPFSETCPVQPLPITLVLFDGAYNETMGHVDLYWESSSESHNSHYEIYHSTSGYDFTHLKDVDGSGTTQSNIHYSAEHNRPARGMNYYQLYSVDYDGTKHDKGIVAINVEAQKVFYDRISNSIIFPENGRYTLYNSAGQLIKEVQNTTSTEAPKTGVYFVINNNSGESTKIVVR